MHQKCILSPIIKNIVFNWVRVTSLNLLLPTMINWINETIDESDAIWSWVHWNVKWVNSYKYWIQSNKNCYYPAVHYYTWLNQQNNQWKWWSIKASASKLSNESIHAKIAFNNNKLLLPCCYRRCLIESTKHWMRVMKFEGECIKNI